MREEKREINLHWNELEFLDREVFQRMAPTIIRLEVKRLGKMLSACPVGTEAYNAIVQARYELKKFIGCLEGIKKRPIENSCAFHLRMAIVTLSMENIPLPPEATKTLSRIVDRLNYVRHRMGFIREIR